MLDAFLEVPLGDMAMVPCGEGANRQLTNKRCGGWCLILVDVAQELVLLALASAFAPQLSPLGNAEMWLHGADQPFDVPVSVTQEG